MKKKRKVTEPLYPWAKWMSQSFHTLLYGKHFHCMPHGMAQQYRNAVLRFNEGKADKDKITAHIIVSEEKLEITHKPFRRKKAVVVE